MDAIISRITVVVLRDRGYVAPMLAPSAVYRLPVSDLIVGDHRSLEIRHVVGAHRADRLLIDVDDIRTLLLHVVLACNGGYSVSGDVWLWPQGFEEEDDADQPPS